MSTGLGLPLNNLGGGQNQYQPYNNTNTTNTLPFTTNLTQLATTIRPEYIAAAQQAQALARTKREAPVTAGDVSKFWLNNFGTFDPNTNQFIYNGAVSPYNGDFRDINYDSLPDFLNFAVPGTIQATNRPPTTLEWWMRRIPPKTYTTDYNIYPGKPTDLRGQYLNGELLIVGDTQILNPQGQVVATRPRASAEVNSQRMESVNNFISQGNQNRDWDNQNGINRPFEPLGPGGR